MQSYYNSVAEMQKTALDSTVQRADGLENEKKRQKKFLNLLKEQQMILQRTLCYSRKSSKKITTLQLKKLKSKNNAQTRENQKQNDAAIIAEQQNTKLIL